MYMKTPFIVGKHNIKWVGSTFSEHFGAMSVTPKRELVVECRTLGKPMLDKEILSEFRPQEVDLGFLLDCLDNSNSMLKNGLGNIFYIRDQSNTLWVVFALWYSDNGGWRVLADSVDYPLRWRVGDQVLSRGFSDTVPSDSDPLKSLTLRVEKLEKLFNPTLLTQEK